MHMSDAHPDSICSRLLRRDDGGPSADWAVAIIDSYHDRRNAYQFATTVLGTRTDALRVSDTRSDIQWNAVCNAVCDHATAWDAGGQSAQGEHDTLGIRGAPSHVRPHVEHHGHRDRDSRFPAGQRGSFRGQPVRVRVVPPRAPTVPHRGDEDLGRQPRARTGVILLAAHRAGSPDFRERPTMRIHRRSRRRDDPVGDQAVGEDAKRQVTPLIGALTGEARARTITADGVRGSKTAD